MHDCNLSTVAGKTVTQASSATEAYLRRMLSFQKFGQQQEVVCVLL